MSQTMKARVVKAETGLEKAFNPTNIKEEEKIVGLDSVVPAPYPAKVLRNMVEISTILQQCVEAYKRNIVGFGASLSYEEDDTQLEETTEMKAEWTRIKEWLKYFNFDSSFEDVFAQAIEDRETIGNGYIEILRDGTGLPDGGEYVDGVNMKITKLTEPIEVEYKRGKKKFKRQRQFRRYVQVVGEKKVWFKEFGDSRIMDKDTGNFVKEGTIIPEEQQANEILHLKIGNNVYGIPRWIGQLVHMYGARKAEELNYRYFTQGRHIPMAILLHNSKLSPESEEALEDYIKSVEGSDNSHKFLIIEAEGEEEGILQDEKKQARVELKSLADMLQQDALFLEYDDSSREKVQSSFRLPDIYVGRSKDFNRATADMARQITEEQVFEPERNSLEWLILNKLLVEFELQHVRVVFNKPEIGDSEDLARMISALGELGAYAPNDLRELAGRTINKDLEPFEGEEFDKPSKGATPTQAAQPSTIEEEEGNEGKGNKQVKKSKDNEQIVLVLKDLRDALEEMKDNKKTA